MAIGFLFSHPLARVGGLLLLAFGLLTLRCSAQDQLKKKDGNLIFGQVLNVSEDGANRQVWVASHSSSGGVVKVFYYLSDIDSVTMAVPAEVTAVKDAAPADVIKALEPIVKQYAGLPTDWVVEAMAQLAEAYATAGQNDRAGAAYNQIDLLYPGSKYHKQAVAGKALLSLKQGKVDEAIAALQPLIDEANKTIVPPQAEAGPYASVFLVYGQVLEAQKKPAQALEAYMTVKTIFYQNPAQVGKADALAKKLREENPGLGVD